MPSKSRKQHDLMLSVAHSPEFAKKVGIKQEVAREFIEADREANLWQKPAKDPKPKK